MVELLRPNNSEIGKAEATQLTTIRKPRAIQQGANGSSTKNPPANYAESGTAAVAQKGKFLHAIYTNKEKQKSWIIDSRASDHMTGDLTMFNSYSPCPNNFTVWTLDS